MSEFNAGRQGPWPAEGRVQAERDHEQAVREEADRERGVKMAVGAKRRRWWPFRRSVRGGR